NSGRYCQHQKSTWKNRRPSGYVNSNPLDRAGFPPATDSGSGFHALFFFQLGLMKLENIVKSDLESAFFMAAHKRCLPDDFLFFNNDLIQCDLFKLSGIGYQCLVSVLPDVVYNLLHLMFDFLISIHISGDKALNIGSAKLLVSVIC